MYDVIVIGIGIILLWMLFLEWGNQSCVCVIIIVVEMNWSKQGLGGSPRWD